MNLGLEVLGQIMKWTDDRAGKEFDWLKLMSRLKYDGYRDFQAGMRFIESLATWLQQFKPQEREAAYAFVRSTLVYIGPSEMQRLVEQFYPRTVRDRLVRLVARKQGIRSHRVLIDKDARAASERARSRSDRQGRPGSKRAPAPPDSVHGVERWGPHRHDPSRKFGFA